MKKVILALVILAIIITAGILENVYVDKVFDGLNERLYELQALIEEENDAATSKVRELGSWWEKKRGYLELFTYSTDLRAFSVALGETEGSLDCGDYQNSLSKVRSLLVMSDNIHKILDFNLIDII